MVKQNIRTRKNNQRKRRTKIQKGGRQGRTQEQILCQSKRVIESPLGKDFLTDRGIQDINEIFPTPSVCSEVSSEINKEITEEIIKESIKDLKSLLINNDLFEGDRKQFTFNCFKNFRAYGCPYESIIMEKDTTFENFLNFSSFANSFEDVEFLDLRNVKEMKYIPMNLSKMISLKYLLLPIEFAPPDKAATNSAVEYSVIENEVHIFDIIRMMPSLRYVEAPKPPEPYKQEVEAAKAKKAAAEAAAAAEAEAEAEAGREAAEVEAADAEADAEAEAEAEAEAVSEPEWIVTLQVKSKKEAAAEAAAEAAREAAAEAAREAAAGEEKAAEAQKKTGKVNPELKELNGGSIFRIPTDILEMYGSTQTEGTDSKIKEILDEFKDNNDVLMFPKLDYEDGKTYQPNLIVNFSGKSFF